MNLCVPVMGSIVYSSFYRWKFVVLYMLHVIREHSKLVAMSRWGATFRCPLLLKQLEMMQ